MENVAGSESSLKVALIQPLISKSKPESLGYFAKVLESSECANLDVICLPELWYTRVVINFEEEFSGILELAKQKNSIIIPGAFLEKRNGNIFVSCPVISKNGNILGRQLKIHPFGLQKKRVKSGSRAEIFDFGTFKIGVVICYDSVFPEVPRTLALKGADVLFFPSKIRTEGIKPWNIYIQARALENRIPAVAANVCGGHFGGRSMIVNFDYNKKQDIALPRVKVLSSQPQKYVTTIELENSRQIRKRRFKNVKLDPYYLL
jgi:predicted amidohydrolase